jgi:large subunit ribosomal protein L6
MSRIGKKPVPVVQGVTVSVSPSAAVVKGPKGTLEVPIPRGITCRVDDGRVLVERGDDTKARRALHGLTRALLANAVAGVTQGFKKELDIEGIGYRAQLQAKTVVFSLGYSHPVEFQIPEGIQVTVEKQTHLVITGASKQLVGQVAADMRSLRKPDVYKGKGVRYTGELIRKKVGKTGAK